MHISLLASVRLGTVHVWQLAPWRVGVDGRALVDPAQGGRRGTAQGKQWGKFIQTVYCTVVCLSHPSPFLHPIVDGTEKERNDGFGTLWMGSLPSSLWWLVWRTNKYGGVHIKIQ